MYRPRLSILLSAAGVIVLGGLEAIFGFEALEFWQKIARPYISENWLSASTAVFEFIGSFWGGAIVALAFVAGVEAWLRRRAKDEDERAPLDGVAAQKHVTSPRTNLPQPTSAALSNDAVLEGMARADRDDYDLIAQKFYVRAVRTDDGIDIKAVIQFRNRSKRSLHLKGLFSEYVLDGKATRKTTGITTPIPPEKTVSLGFNALRIYNESDPEGAARLTLMFGGSSGEMRTVLDMSYSFGIRSYPPNKSNDAVLEIDLKEEVRYFVSEKP